MNKPAIPCVVLASSPVQWLWTDFYLSGVNMQNVEVQYYKKLGAAIRSARKKQKISLKDVAAQTGVTFQQLQKYECGENRITVFRLIQIAKAIGIKATDIINN